MSDDTPLAGRLHVYVAFDWGEEVDLAVAQRQGAGVFLDMVRRPRTPASIAYRPPPLRFPLGPVAVSMPGLDGPPLTHAEATVFDFGGVSVAFVFPFSMSRGELRLLAAKLTEPATAKQIRQTARAVLEPLFHKLMPAITRPDWPETLWEEYFVFQFAPCEGCAPERLLGEDAGWLAGLLRLEDEPLSGQETAEALKLTLRYGTRDLFVPDWAAAALVDHEGESDETLQAVEFANLQLLEYRHIDQRLDAVLARADDLLRKGAGGRLPLFGHGRPLRELGELKVEANGLFERTGNVLKLVGDQYVSRLYRLLSTRFHLPEWEKSIGRKLEVLEGVYEAVSDQAAHFRSELLEVLVVLLIVTEIVISLVKH
ncbi:MAG: hypothetical protein K2W96_01845 [Gemmataceae bacterium]|nr:hypothetical protein [Gemmataceae bacterium]